MQLAVIHYHFDQGGVTQVVKNHLRSLAALGPDNPVERAVLLHGGRATGLDVPQLESLPLPVDVVGVDQLEYDESTAVADDLPARLESALRRHGLSPDQDVLHIHNHTLGKNVSLTAATGGLARRGWRLLLQIHDFAEDYRPANYRRLVDAFGPPPAAAYPVAPQIQYASLTGRDAAALREAGIVAAVLPNPVAAPPVANDPSAARARVAEHCQLQPHERLLIYPVRGIRRKNLGETALWAAALQGRARVLQTMPPANPLELPSYQAWQRHAALLELPLQLGSGSCSFADVISASDAVLTTSVAEGFGMVFLEPWLAQRPLFGRNLPDITADFTAAGIQFNQLYERLPVPLDWVGESRFRNELSGAFQRAAAGLENLVDHGAVQQQLDALTADGQVDFAMLSPTAQAEVVARVARAPDSLPAAAAVAMDIDRTTEGELAANAQVVAEQFSPRTLGRRLAELYGDLLSRATGEVAEASDSQLLLERFLRIDRLHPARLAWDAWEAGNE